ncbi:MAG: FtsX-like permease family protein [Herbinix sp.]|nr:FtsX-like permease family protein [Herbinix sp.]
MRLILHMAVGNLRNHRLRGFISGFLIFFSTVAIIIATTICTTINNNMEAAVIHSCTGDLQIHNSEMADIDVYSSTVAEIPLLLDSGKVKDQVSTPGIENIASRLRLQGLVMTEDQSTSVTLTGIESEIEKNISTKLMIIEGSYITKENGIIVGKDLYDDLEAEIGQAMTFYSTDLEGNVTDIPMVIEGVFTSDGLSIFMDTYLFAELNYVRKEIGFYNEEATEVVIDLDGSVPKEKVITNIRKGIIEKGQSLRIDKWEDIAQAYSSIISASTLIPVAMIVLIFIVVGLGLVNMVIMAILERMKEVKVLIALGTRHKSIIFINSLEYLLLGIIASAIGGLVCVPVILILGNIGIPATTGMIEYVFGGSKLYMGFQPLIIFRTVVILTLFPALIASIISSKSTKNISLVNIS